MQRPDWAPEGVDISKPNMARSYDYWLGGSHNFAVDREFGDKFAEILPSVRRISQANRAFVHRAVRYMLDLGIRQFLDLGSGIPTVGNVHEVAQRIAPESKVVYVDIDPIAVTHSQQLLADNDNGTVLQGDMTKPDEIWHHPEARAMLDFSQPIGVLMVAVVHALQDHQNPDEHVAYFRDALPPGSALALTHGSTDRQSSSMRELEGITQKSATPLVARTRDQILNYFGDFELAEPGLVWVNMWRPELPDEEEEDESITFYAGVGHKR
ncbi:MAG TPA: SAM-dependent methyltransferase [Candidatus Stackebrandtia faecavium]|nr:SAM-dependent methyltransferase [Candidatus Stackebrandtia faecavium]